VDESTVGCSNRSAIGARVTVHWRGQQQAQEVTGGSGFCSQNQRALHFGLGEAGVVDKVIIRWPSGHVQEVLRPAVNRVHRIRESA
jgi:hypothetical protein